MFMHQFFLSSNTTLEQTLLPHWLLWVHSNASYYEIFFFKVASSLGRLSSIPRDLIRQTWWTTSQDFITILYICMEHHRQLYFPTRHRNVFLRPKSGTVPTWGWGLWTGGWNCCTWCADNHPICRKAGTPTDFLPPFSQTCIKKSWAGNVADLICIISGTVDPFW